MARSEGAEGPAQHLADAVAAPIARAEQPGKYLAVHAPKLAVKPRLQILRQHRRSLLLRLEHSHRPTVEDHVNRAPRLGLHRSINLKIGITMKKPKLQVENPQPRQVQRADLAPTTGYAIVVDGHFKTEFVDEGAAKKTAAELLAKYPMLRIEIYKASSRSRTLLK